MPMSNRSIINLNKPAPFYETFRAAVQDAANSAERGPR